MNKISVLLLCCTVSLSTSSFAQEKKATPPKEVLQVLLI